MRDEVLATLRRSWHVRLPHRADTHGTVDQTRSARRLFSGDFSASGSAGEEFDDSLLGIGVMHDLAGEIVSVRGETWRIPTDGTPVPVHADEGVAFGIAARGGREHRLILRDGFDMEGILSIIDDYLARHHVSHEDVVAAVEISGRFSDVLLRTVAPPARPEETLGEVIDEEVRFTFDDWDGTLVGFRFPDETDGRTIPGLHLHGISHDLSSGGHVRNATTGRVNARIWVDELHPLIEANAAENIGSTDFSRYEGPVR